MNYTECKNCPDRRVGCHNVVTCSKWAEHEKLKAELYSKKAEESERIYKDNDYIHKARQRIKGGKKK